MPLLKSQEVSELQAWFAAADDTFERFENLFSSVWCTDSNKKFRVYCIILLFLEERAFKSRSERLYALFILYVTTRKQPVTQSPFAPYLVQVVLDPTRDFVERFFVQHLILKDKWTNVNAKRIITEIVKQNIVQYASEDELWTAIKNRTIALKDVVEPRIQLPQNQTEINQESTIENSIAIDEFTVVPDPYDPDYETEFAQKQLQLDVNTCEELKNLEKLYKPTNTPPLQPNFVREKPPLYTFQDAEEVQWLHPKVDRHLLWLTDDAANASHKSHTQTHTPTPTHSIVVELQGLLDVGCKRSLLPTQQEKFCSAMKLYPVAVASLEIEPDNMPQLVENNPVIAFELLLRQVQHGEGHVLLSKLVSMDVSIHSMEVVNRLSMATCLPAPYLCTYIHNCIKACRLSQDDKFGQTRRVRLVCVFLQSLIKVHILGQKDLHYEIQAFCIEYSWVREAAALFRLLKAMDEADLKSEPDAHTHTHLHTHQHSHSHLDHPFGDLS